MRPVYQNLGAAGNAPWITVNSLQAAFAVGLAVTISSGGVLTYTVQHTFDDTIAFRNVTIARAGTVATVTDVAHGLSVGDSITVQGAGDANLNGTYDVASVVDANSYTYTVVNTGATASVPGTQLISLRVFSHATLQALTTRADGNYRFPPTACRLRITSYTSGVATLAVIQGMGH